MPGSEHILILGGTREAANLARELTVQGYKVTTSLAGRTQDPAPLSGAVRTGGFGGTDKMARWLSENGITEVIDATHPFATTISANAVTACAKVNVKLTVRKRQPWIRQSGDNWIEVETLEKAANCIPKDARVLLALGSQHLTPFHNREDIWFLIRMVDQPENRLPFRKYKLLPGRPSNDWNTEAELLKSHDISHIVCRNSGGTGAYAKIEAARHLAIPVIIVTMPK